MPPLPGLEERPREAQTGFPQPRGSRAQRGPSPHQPRSRPPALTPTAAATAPDTSVRAEVFLIAMQSASHLPATAFGLGLFKGRDSAPNCCSRRAPAHQTRPEPLAGGCGSRLLHRSAADFQGHSDPGAPKQKDCVLQKSGAKRGQSYAENCSRLGTERCKIHLQIR